MALKIIYLIPYFTDEKLDLEEFSYISDRLWSSNQNSKRRNQKRICLYKESTVIAVEPWLNYCPYNNLMSPENPFFFFLASVCGLQGASQVALVVKNQSAMQEAYETWVPSLGWEDPLEESMATHSSTLAWKIPQTEEAGGLQSRGSQRVRQGWSDLAGRHTHGLQDLSSLAGVWTAFTAMAGKASNPKDWTTRELPENPYFQTKRSRREK